MDNEQLFNFDVTCHTEGCENENITIEISTPESEPIILCGPCCIEITDIVPILDEV